MPISRHLLQLLKQRLAVAPSGPRACGRRLPIWRPCENPQATKRAAPILGIAQGLQTSLQLVP